ncbi:hypothetical protein MVEN_01802200 [Mycena venus]|uniref:Uncharacterized protein n=1 Tax=Mycena venus TaxID=2733690 RepID=A0A8H7CLK1_9AGAR|nr:hypothetical protein MVEN_01802200 [Mycena venus]
MLSIFLLLQLLSSNGSKAAHTQTLEARAASDTCNDNSRTLYGIVWSCLVTILACIWVSVHPNIPPPKAPIKPSLKKLSLAYLTRKRLQSLMLFGRRLKMMLVALIAPEVMVGFAARQFLAAWRFSKTYKVSWTHGYFFSMGGFVTAIGHHPIVTEEQLDDKTLAEIQKVTEDEIEDRSKHDALAKGLALVQVIWAIAQSAARVNQQLPVSELEVVTVAFAVVNLFIWVLWWGKPLNVVQAIPISTFDAPEPPLNVEQAIPISTSNAPEPPGLPVKLNILDKFWGVLTGNYTGSEKAPFQPLVATCVPSFWSHYDIDKDIELPAFFTECFVATIFGIIHCLAWHSTFPSHTEMWMWRSCALIIAVVPVGIAVMGASIILSSPDSIFHPVIGFIFISLYIITRLFLTVLPFIALRALPPGTLTDVNWTLYIPHL